MKKLLLLSLASFVAVLVAGCGPSVPATTTFYCESAAGPGHSCDAVTGPNAGAATPCGPDTSVSSCPTTNVLGVCTFSESAGGITEMTTQTWYTDSGETAASAQAACAGTWTNG
jgi:hypothetical protein